MVPELVIAYASYTEAPGGDFNFSEGLPSIQWLKRVYEWTSMISSAGSDFEKEDARDGSSFFFTLPLR